MLRVAIILITYRQSVVLVGSPIDTRSDVRPLAWVGDGFGELCGAVAERIGSADHGEFVNVTTVDVEKVRCAFVDRAANIPVELSGVVWGDAISQKRISRVEGRVIPIRHELPV